MVTALFDTNILIDYLNGIEQAEAELSKYANKAISIITWMEIVTGTELKELDAVKEWLLEFNVKTIDSKIAERAATIRREKRIRLPDAIIWATAQVDSMLLVSRNTKDFPESEVGIWVPYQL